MKNRQRYLAITELRVDLLDANPWNPNRMTEEIRGKLSAMVQATREVRQKLGV